MMNLFKRATLIWLVLFAGAFLNGAIRELLIKKILETPAPYANQISCLTGIVLFSVLTRLFWQTIKISSVKEATAVGLYWFIMTFLTETFLLNRLIGKMSWPEIWQTYNVSQGSFWVLVLIWLGLLPLFWWFIEAKMTKKQYFSK